MRILVFSPFYPPHKGGLESHSDEFNKYLSAQGAEILVFTPQLPQESPEKEVRYHGVTIIRFPAIELIHNYPFPKFWTKRFWQLWQELHEKEYDLVISRTRFFFTSLMAGRFAKYAATPWVHIEHGSDFTHFNNPLKTWLGILYDRTCGAFVLRHSDHVIANSEASAHFVQKLSKRTDCIVIYRGVERETILTTPVNDTIRTLHSNKHIIGFIGRLIDGKGVRDLIEAFSSIRRDTTCFIIGSGPEKVHLERIAKERNITDRVIFFGEKSFSETIALLKTFDIFVNPSYTEGIPTSVIEAALCHKAIIATNVGGTKEIITGTNDGFLIVPHDVTDLKDKIEQLLDNTALRSAYGEQAFQAVVEKFDWRHSAKQYLAVFSKLIKNKEQ